MSLAFRFLLAILILLLCGGRLAFAPAIAGQASADEAAPKQEKSGQQQTEQQALEQQSTLEEEEQQAEEQKAYERFLAILKRRPAAGTALDRVYSYHQDRETLDDFCATLRSDAAGSADGSTSLILGMIELRQGHEEAAIAALENAEKLRPEDSICGWTLGQALVLAGRSQEAVSAFERALKRKPARANRLLIFIDLGRAAKVAGGSDEALKVWKRLEAEQPDDERVLEIIASISLEEGDLQNAIQRYEQLADRTKDEFKSVQFRLRSATLRLRLGEREEARSILNKLLDQLDPESWVYRDVREQLESTYLEAGDSAGLFAWFEHRLQQHPDELVTIVRIAELSAQQGKKEQAKDWYSKAITVAPSNSKLRESLIEFLEASGDIAGAIHQYEQLASISPGNLDHMEAHGRLWLRRRDCSEAERKSKATEVWSTMLSGHEKDADVVRQLADILKSADFSEEALQRYQEAVNLAPENPQYRRYLGDYLFQLRRRSEAFTAWAEIASGDRRTPENLLELTSVLLANGLKKQAIETLSAACEMRPEFSQLLRLAEMQRSFVDGGARPYIADSLKTLERAAELAESEDDRVLIVDSRINSLEASNRLSDFLQQLKERVSAAGTAPVEDWLMLAIGYLRLEQISVATEITTQARTEHANSVAILRAHAQICQQAGRLADAIDANRRLMDVDRRLRQEYLVRIAELQVQVGQPAEAIQTGRTLLSLAPGNVEQADWFAQLCEQCGNREEGLKVIRRLSRAAPGDVEMRTLLAAALERSQLFGEAFEVWWSLYLDAQSDAARSTAIERLSQLALQQGTFAEVVRRLNMRLQQNEQDRTVLLGLAEAHLAVEDLISARSTLERLLQRDEGSVMVLDQLALICDRLGDYDAAAGYRRKQYRLEPNEGNESQYILALQRAGMYGEAESLIMSQVGPDTPAISLLRMIDRAIDDGAVSLAERMCNLYIERHEHPELAILRKGVLQWTEGQRADACSSFRTILQITQSVPFDHFFDCIAPGKTARRSTAFNDATILQERLFASRVLLLLNEVSEEETQYLGVPTIGLSRKTRSAIRIPLSEIDSIAAVREFALIALSLEHQDSPDGILRNVASPETPEVSQKSDAAAIAAWDQWVFSTTDPGDQMSLQSVIPLSESGSPHGTIAYLNMCIEMTLISEREPENPGVAEVRKDWSERLPKIKQLIRQLLQTDPQAATPFLAAKIQESLSNDTELNQWITELTRETSSPSECRLGIELEFTRNPTIPPRWSLSEYRKLLRHAYSNAPLSPELLAPWIHHHEASLSDNDLLEILSDVVDAFVRESEMTTVRLQVSPTDVHPMFWAALLQTCHKKQSLVARVAEQFESNYHQALGKQRYIVEVVLAELASYRGDRIEAARHWIRCIQCDPENATIRRQVSLSLQAAGLYAEAITVMDGVSESDPEQIKEDEFRILSLARLTNQPDRSALSLRRLGRVQLSEEEAARMLKVAEELQLTDIVAELRARPSIKPSEPTAKSQYEYMEEYDRLGKTEAAVAIARQIARKKIGEASYNFRQQNQRSPFQMRERAFAILKQAGAMEDLIAEQKALLDASPNSQVLREELITLLRAAGREQEAAGLQTSEAGNDVISGEQQVKKLMAEGKKESASLLVLGWLKDPRRKSRALTLLEDYSELSATLFSTDHGVELLEACLETTSSKGLGRQAPAFRGRQVNALASSLIAVAMFSEDDPHSFVPVIERAWEGSADSIAWAVVLQPNDAEDRTVKACSALIELVGCVGEKPANSHADARDDLVGAVFQLLARTVAEVSAEEREYLHAEVVRVSTAKPSLREWPVALAITAGAAGNAGLADESLRRVVEESQKNPFAANIVQPLDAAFPDASDMNSVLSIFDATLCRPISSPNEESSRYLVFAAFVDRAKSQGGQEQIRSLIPRIKYGSQTNRYGVAKKLAENYPWQGLVALSGPSPVRSQSADLVSLVADSCGKALTIPALVDEWQAIRAQKTDAGAVRQSVTIESAISWTPEGNAKVECPLMDGIWNSPETAMKANPDLLLELWLEASENDYRNSALFLCTAALLLKQNQRDINLQIQERLIELVRSGQLDMDLSNPSTTNFTARKKAVLAIFLLGGRLEKIEGCAELSDVLMTSAKAALQPVATEGERMAMARVRGAFLLRASRQEEAAAEFREVLNLLLNQPETALPAQSLESLSIQGTPEADKEQLLNELRKTGLAP
ncbi:MAG: tetratricopeptide repeat protein [Planctomycetaceae bacterium]